MISKIKAALTAIPNNKISLQNPYCIFLSMSALGKMNLALIQTDGLMKPAKLDTRCLGMVKIIRREIVYRGSTSKSSFYRALPEFIVHRDLFNAIHNKSVTVELMKSILDPELKQEAVKAICLNAV